MVGRALEAGIPASWVAGDEVYGNDPRLRADLVERGIGYVLAVAKDHRITTGIGVRKAIELPSGCPNERGSDSRPGPARKGNASTSGH